MSEIVNVRMLIEPVTYRLAPVVSSKLHSFN
jgi:hypothetical protein